MSDTNADVASPESVVDFPSEYRPPPEEAEAGSPAEAESEAAANEEEPVSLDGPAEEAEADPETEENETEAGGEGEDDPEPEVIEFDFGGNKLEVPKDAIPSEVAEGLDKFSKDIWADYTRKSQANADVAKSLKARDDNLGKLETLSGEQLDAFARGRSLQMEIEQLRAIDHHALRQSNPDQARWVSDELAAKQAELQSVFYAIEQHEQTLSQQRQAELERRMDEGKQALDRQIKGFSTEIAPKLVAYVQETYGMSAEDAAEWPLNPALTVMAHKAMLYDQMQKAGKPKADPKPAKPVRAMPNKGGARGAVNQNDMSFAELGKVLGLQT